MTMEQDFRALIKASPVVSALTEIVDWGVVPPGAPYPFAAMQVITSSHLHSQSGPEGLTVYTVQVSCYALSYGEAKELSNAIRSVVDGYKGGGFDGIMLRSLRDGQETDPNAADRPFYAMMDFLVAHQFVASP